MKVLVCGGRNFNDYAWVKKILDQVHTGSKGPIKLIISGMARGADMLGVKWAQSNSIPIDKYHANWEIYGKSAGPIRNQEMLKQGKPDIVIAFPGGSGTSHMISITKKASIPFMDFNSGENTNAVV